LHSLGNWKESDERVVSLEEEDPEAFAAYMQAIYVGADISEEG
jgi:hypothetical protein